MELQQDVAFEYRHQVEDPNTGKYVVNGKAAVIRELMDNRPDAIPVSYHGVRDDILKQIAALGKEFENDKAVQKYFSDLKIGKDDPRYIEAKKSKVFGKITKPQQEK